jgi:hypothetical protein
MARKMALKRDIIAKIGLNTSLKKKRFRAILMSQRAFFNLFWPQKSKYPLINTTVLYFTATVLLLAHPLLFFINAMLLFNAALFILFAATFFI